jgi:arsenical pump membrane protein
VTPAAAAPGQQLPLGHFATVLAFLVAVTIVAELADAAGVFDQAAHLAARLGRGRTLVLWGYLVVLASVSTIVLSLDTTAVLLTPVVLVLCRQVGLPPLPFALTTAWLANTASLLLPVSNLTNLLSLHAVGRLGLTQRDFLGLTLWPSVAAIAATAVVLGMMFARGIPKRFTPAPRTTLPDRVLFWTATGVCLALVPLFVAGVPVLYPAASAAAILLVVFALRRPDVLRWKLVPWRPVAIAAGLFAVVEVAFRLGLADVLARAIPGGTGAGSLVAIVTAGAVGGNAFNNLPAYLALSPTTSDAPERIVALLIGTNLAVLVTPWASLANLLWHERCKRAGVSISWRTFAWRGSVAAIVVTTAATAALLLAS